MITIHETKHVEDDKGVWLIIAADHEEALRVQVSPPRDEKPPMVSLWWRGSATAGTVAGWVGNAIERLPDTSYLECRIKVRAEGAASESSSYRIDSLERMKDDIQRWVEDGGIVCSIVNTSQNNEIIYMWAELRSERNRHVGQVGLHYEANALQTSTGRQVFSHLIQETAARHLSLTDSDQLSNVLAETILSSVKTSPRLQAYTGIRLGY